ncbi:TetR/AcrR family transcriptional regulator [Winogradskya consettensis]|uniref:TetR family transcriptional regulator n=1 Tax=Winogradskya consettensis TaxID=113560 RepID=A0A919SE07_9ACTN|nr:TetR/AcrR family transcriptional regulator [Actinoplanes consettensis]GIM70111.1 TetR family transcriptional regulator [Actinoplanes consettensis]
MTRPRTGPRRDPEAQRRALAAAAELLTELGFHKVTMERIAERSGVAKMTLYRWWPNKAAIITDAVRDTLAPATTPDTGSVTTDARTQLDALIKVIAPYGDASVTAAAMSSRGEQGRADLAGILQPWHDSLVTILERGRTRGELAQDFPVTVTADAWMGYVVYRVVFLQQDITEADLTALVTAR